MEEHLVIPTRLGKLRGKVCQSTISNKKYYAFLGIPYAKPPIDKLRFKAPQPFDSWEGVRDALEDGSDCKQPIFFHRPGMDPNAKTEGSEDCLFLCVYTSELPEKSSIKKPVMVHIHGGGFSGGSGNSKNAGPDHLLEGDVVIVSFNYRCGALGFLSLENEEVPGNAGLKDQTLALKWVRDNIDSFGGDPNNVTIFGISAGGASVHYHLLSPLSKGLFHKAIIQSGFAQNPWGFQPSPKKVALKLAKMLGCKSEDPQEVLEFLQSVPSDDIVVATTGIAKEKEFMMWLGLVFSPCVEVAGTEKFLPDSPNNLMRRGDYNKVPTVHGICENEGAVCILFAIVQGVKLEDLSSAINSNPDLLVPSFFGLKHGSSEKKEVQRKIWDFYFKGEALSLNNFNEFMKYQSDFLFNIGFGETRRYLLANAFTPTYSYLFTNNTQSSMFSSLFSPDNPASKFISGSGTCHGADTCFLLSISNGMITTELTPDFKEATLRHSGTWTKFASSGVPNSELVSVRWDEDSETRPCYMDIGTAWVMREGQPLADRIAFWKDLTDKYCTS